MIKKKKGSENTYLIILGVLTLFVIVAIAIFDHLQGISTETKLEEIKQTTSIEIKKLTTQIDKLTNETSQKLTEINQGLSQLKESTPNINIVNAINISMSKEAFDFFCSQVLYDSECSFTKFNKLEENTKYNFDTVYIYNFGRKTTNFRIEFECREWDYYAIAYPKEATLENNFEFSIMLKIPEIDQIKPAKIYLLHKSKSPISCKIKYSSDDIEKEEETIQISKLT